MRITFTNSQGEVWAEHDLDPEVAGVVGKELGLVEVVDTYPPDEYDVSRGEVIVHQLRTVLQAATQGEDLPRGSLPG